MPPELLEVVDVIPLPPHATSPTISTSASIPKTTIWRLLLRAAPIPKNAATPNADSSHGSTGRRIAALADAVTTTFTVPSGFTVDGLTLHVVFVAPVTVHVNVTVPLNPFLRCRISGSVADDPLVIVTSAVLKNDTPKSAVAAVVQFDTRLNASTDPSPVTWS